jgi:transposase
MRANKQTYTEQFRQDAIAHYRNSNKSFRQVAFDLGINAWTLREWYTHDEIKRSAKKRPTGEAAARAPSGEETVEEKAARLEREVARLERENAQLKMDRDILKKATAFFAKESE